MNYGRMTMAADRALNNKWSIIRRRTTSLLHIEEWPLDFHLYVVVSDEEVVLEIPTRERCTFFFAEF